MGTAPYTALELSLGRAAADFLTIFNFCESCWDWDRLRLAAAMFECRSTAVLRPCCCCWTFASDEENASTAASAAAARVIFMVDERGLIYNDVAIAALLIAMLPRR